MNPLRRVEKTTHDVSETVRETAHQIAGDVRTVSVEATATLADARLAFIAIAAVGLAALTLATIALLVAGTGGRHG